MIYFYFGVVVKERERSQINGQKNWAKRSSKPPPFPKCKVEKSQKTKSMDLKQNGFGSIDLKKKSCHGRYFTKKDEYMFLDYSRNIKQRNGSKSKMKKGTTL